jgi:hypothetical protein
METTANEEVLISEIESLRTRLSYAESSDHRTRQQYQALAEEHYRCQNANAHIQALENDIDRTREKYEDEQDKNERLGERIRLMKRTSHDSYRQRYEEQMAEIQSLRRRVQDQEGQIMVQQTRIADKDRRISVMNRAIVYFKNYLRGLGYVVESPV